MTPGARIAAAIEILDSIQGGQPAEQALTRWARSSRFAGSGDRAAIRDHVFDVLRNRCSDACRGGGETGRSLMIGRVRAEGTDMTELFNGVGHAPEPLSAAEQSVGEPPQAKEDTWNVPNWLADAFTQSLGERAEATAQALTLRAPVTLRVNTSKTNLSDARARLLDEGIETKENSRAETALTITKGPRRLRNSSSYLNGLVELQDGSSQAAIAGVQGTGTALDFCAGGGGKALALAASGWRVTAHDMDANRMGDIPARALRGGHEVAICPPEDIGRAGAFDLVFCDAPCSGSGTWRRAPEAKWTLTPAKLQDLIKMQAQVLDAAQDHVAPNGQMVYATCSVLNEENEGQIDAFLARCPDWQVTHMQRWDVDEWGDGFFVAHLARH
ncbi:RsmB/NOP family class I SAM-dependent RNA methyltransferase [Tateyamaria sp. Alg231-49]|uniref:RsmB/NOP family class I SAM-dependent RNA methyltransferase n=1 Tax=Tateyamaria sp. Alg231-49 TaxID=1922219 RepID=UPI000D55DB60|nr:RsmB/NOP family class I SAM-dependent RNA methyltransferase [Tateyamaria sp. Alg231-49]